MKNNSLKILAQKAKKRLSTAGQNISVSDEKTTKMYLSQKDYAFVVTRQCIEDDPLYEKVKKVMQKGDIINPLAELTDYAVFNTLTSSEKEKYMIDISKRYNKIKEYVTSHDVKV